MFSRTARFRERTGMIRDHGARGWDLHCVFGRPLGLFLLLAVCLLVSPGEALPSPPDAYRATFLPQWLPQAQFAGFYVAQAKGFYKARGIDLTILKGGPDLPAGPALAAGRADFVTLFLAETLKLRDRGLDLVNIAQLVQRSGFILVANRQRGIVRPEDLNGKKVSLWTDFQTQPLAFFRRYGVEVRPVVQGSTVNLFLRGGVDAACAMWYNEYHTILSAGIDENELTVFFFDRHGLNFPEDGIYARRETCLREPELCRRFVAATLEGWEYAFGHPEEALQIVMKAMEEANVMGNRVHQRWMLNRMRDLMGVGDSGTPLGVLRREDYRRVAEELEKNGLIKASPPYGDFHVPLLSRP